MENRKLIKVGLDVREHKRDWSYVEIINIRAFNETYERDVMKELVTILTNYEHFWCVRCKNSLNQFIFY